MQPRLPIGYWLRQADNLLTEQINTVQAANGVSRSDWQVLNMLKEIGSASREQIFETLNTFVDRATFDKLMTHLIEYGWVEPGDISILGAETFQLTGVGQHKHEVIFDTQKQVRQRAMHGITEEEYGMVIRVLQQIVNNLGESSDQNE